MSTWDEIQRQRTAMGVTQHRPWPLPDRGWLMGQTWKQLLFAHWRVDPEELRRVVPSPLELDLREGAAWIGITPFVVSALRLRRTPPLPVGSHFPELNVRTYVRFGGKPGIYFLSLDASSSLAVAAARRAYRLPYFRARMSAARQGSVVAYESRRMAGPDARFAAWYRPHGESIGEAPGSVGRWLAERYCLYTLDQGGRVLRAEIHHRPWPLRRAEAQISLNTMTESSGIRLRGQPLLHYSDRQDTVIWAPQAADRKDESAT